MGLYNDIKKAKYGLEYDLMAANFLMNSTATLLNSDTRKKEEQRRLQESRLDQFIETPFDRYTYESYSNSPYMRKGGMVNRMRYKEGGIFTQDLYRDNGHSPSKHKPNIGLNDALGITPVQTEYGFKKGGLYTRDKEAYINGGNITMAGINTPVMAFPDGDDPVLMMPGKNYNFPNSTGVREYKMQEGGEVGFWDNLGQEDEIYDSTSEPKKSFSKEPIQPPKPISSFKTTRGKRNNLGLSIKNGLVERGFSNEEAAAITGNIFAESGFKPEAVNPTSKAYGLMQWLGSRKNKLFSKYGENPTLDNQLDYIAWELQGGNKYESKQFRRAMQGKTLEEKTYNFGKYVERPSQQELNESINRRNEYAKLYE